MKIPKRFKLFGETINIVYKKELVTERDALAESHANLNEIWMQYDIKGERMASTFFHEVVHMILDKMHNQSLSNDEAFVNIFGQLLHQIITTMEY